MSDRRSGWREDQSQVSVKEVGICHTALGALEWCVRIKVILESQRPKHTWL